MKVRDAISGSSNPYTASASEDELDESVKSLMYIKRVLECFEVVNATITM